MMANGVMGIFQAMLKECGFRTPSRLNNLWHSNFERTVTFVYEI
jgi:hypothetical protein